MNVTSIVARLFCYVKMRSMTVTLELKPETEAKAIQQAASRGVAVEDLLIEVIETNLNSENEKPFYETATNEDWESALDEFANSPSFAKAAGRFVDDSR
jgi:hypothetical protein